MAANLLTFLQPTQLQCDLSTSLDYTCCCACNAVLKKKTRLAERCQLAQIKICLLSLCLTVHVPCVQVRGDPRLKRSVIRDSSIPQGSIRLPPSLTENLTLEEQQLASRVQFNFYQRSTFFQVCTFNHLHYFHYTELSQHNKGTVFNFIPLIMLIVNKNLFHIPKRCLSNLTCVSRVVCG